MDWGLFRSSERGKRYLRGKLLYPVWFYYYAMVSNGVMRFFWVLGVIRFSQPWVDQSQLIVLVQSLVEGFRRAQWALIRIENENVNNFERYRTILQIPAFKEDYEDGATKEE
jgi:EXS family